jgi:hypothetical protein
MPKIYEVEIDMTLDRLPRRETSGDAVRQALLLDEQVEGAHLVTDRFSLQIR